MTADPIDIALQVARIFEKLGLAYVLGGSLASVAHGEPRATLGVDMAVHMQVPVVDPLIAAVEGDFFVHPDWMREEVRRNGSFQLVHRATMTRVDIFVPQWTGLHLWKWQTRQRIAIGPDAADEIDITSAEGIVLQKLLWFRDGGETSEKQWRDILGVLKNQATRIETVCLRDMARELGIASLLERAFAAAGLPPAASG
ncbi:MAG TPA: hypothetical protein PKE00_09005 [Planctomycetota bacterium]|nr:hypothetical protein [Planctomycetota bacterium]